MQPEPEPGAKTLPDVVADFTRPELILPRLREQDAPGIVSELSQALQRHGCIHDVLPFYQAALNSELLNNSAQVCGMAFPHARLHGIKKLQFALGRAPQPVAWSGKGFPPVQLIFLLAIPASDAAKYLHLCASLARLGQESELRNELLEARTPEAMLAVLRRIKLKQDETSAHTPRL